MGRETKTFRQTNKAGRADAANKSYAKINRQGPWRQPNPLKKGEK